MDAGSVAPQPASRTAPASERAAVVVGRENLAAEAAPSETLPRSVGDATPAAPDASAFLPAAALAGIGLGANLGAPAAQVEAALAALAALPGSRLVARSSLYRSVAVGPQPQPDYCNAAALLETRLSPSALLGELQRLEDAAGRDRRAALRWAARPLDLDLLFHGETVLQAPSLTLPHPELRRRNFVLVPLAEIAPAFVLPGLGLVAALAAALPRDGLALWQASAAEAGGG